MWGESQSQMSDIEVSPAVNRVQRPEPKMVLVI